MSKKQKFIGEEIKAKRLALGWSQMQLAANAGVSIPTIHRIESGKVVPQKSTIKLILAALTGRF